MGIWRFYDHQISTMRFPILARQHFYFEMSLCLFDRQSVTCHYVEASFRRWSHTDCRGDGGQVRRRLKQGKLFCGPHESFIIRMTAVRVSGWTAPHGVHIFSPLVVRDRIVIIRKLKGLSEHYSDVTWTRWCLKSSANGLSVQQLLQADQKENINLRIIDILWRESPSRFPAQRSSNTEMIYMIWRKHEYTQHQTTRH